MDRFVTKAKRLRREPHEARTAILDAAERLLAAEGYAAVSTRRVAREAGLTAGLIHYYYPTTDDLFIALHRRMTEHQTEQIRQALASEHPLLELWRFQSSWSQASLGIELVALANHRKAIAREIGQCAQAARLCQTEMLRPLLGDVPHDPALRSPAALMTLLVALGRALINEQSVGLVDGHAELRDYVERMISPGS